MVVTRRTPAPPAPTSRTHSAQPIPRLAKKATQDASGAPDKSSPLSNGSTANAATDFAAADVNKALEASPKGVKSTTKQKQKKSGKKKSNKSSGFVELLFRIFLLWFTIYTLSVCPEDDQLKSPICRGLHEYRRLVIDPYIIPPIQHALAHPAVAPYVEKAKPYADYAVRTAKPVAERAQKEFNARVVPQWNKRVVPLYYKYAVPQLVRLDAQTVPYRSRAEQEYERLLGPYLRQAIATLAQWQRKARPYVALAAEKTYDGYQRARPYVRPIWAKVKVIVAQLLAMLGEQRRQFVDPHVKKIWEHVKELSSGKHQGSSASQLRKTASSQLSKASSQVSQASVKLSSSLSSIASSVVSGTTAISGFPASDDLLASASNIIPEVVTSSATQLQPVGEATAAAKSVASVAADKVSSAAEGASDAVKATASMISGAVSPSLSSVVSAASDAAVPLVSSLASSASSAVHASKDAASSVAEEIPTSASSQAESATAAVRHAGSALSSAATSVAGAAASSAASVQSVASSALGDASVTVTQGLAPVVDSLSSIVSPVAEPDPHLLEKLSDPDLEAFKAELGLTDDLFAEPGSEPSSASAPAPVESESEEEKEARLRARREKNAQNRADIERRHTEWERKLSERIAANKKALRKALVALRKAAAAELKENVEIRKEVEDLVEDAEKYLRGAEKYLANLQKETRSPEEKKAIWARVIAKVDEKFEDRLHQTEVIVNGWYEGVLNKELAEVKKVVDEVKDIVDRAQADIGLDYAYLDDVTYLDWQRYHDLARKGENFTAHVQSIQDGSHPSPPINPVLPAIADLQNEVEDVVAGFQTRLRRINRNGARSFGTPDEDPEDAGETEPVSGDGTVSILPIEESALPEHTQSPADVDVPPVVIGRSKEEVEAALNRVADLEGDKTSSPSDAGKNADSDAVAQSLKEEIVREETSRPPLHEEL
ncbi:hypothetical protein BN946_scf184851.g35 [Trametes cinnabarina]|uniref:Uncharacterized protein n=1 Tax=Pycnoporus cinnabarinus TaxID=5643 RepID=A0A060S5C4_PYCCI|nr:hypothetical protein BN946_scf184851.g35 [Trametes cinnabarina]